MPIEMALAPELATIGGIAGKFKSAGLVGELITGMIRGETGRDLIDDARRLVAEYGGDEYVSISGLENIGERHGGLIVINHPNSDVLLPAILNLMVKVYDHGGHRPVFLMGEEIPMTQAFNKIYPVPGSIALIRRFQHLYSDNIIPVPVSRSRKDYRSGRALAFDGAMSKLESGGIVFISPEGHVEVGNTISPIETFHSGTGRMAIMASAYGINVLPVGILGENGRRIRVQIGKPFLVEEIDGVEAVRVLMERIAGELPPQFRGPFA